MKIRDISVTIPILLATGFSTKVAPDVLEEIGVSRILIKPFNKNELLEIIRAMIDGNHG